jgi:hypothetical protein
MKKLLVVVAMLAIAASPLLAATASKDGTPVTPVPASPGERSQVRADFEYNTGGAIDFVPDLGGSATGWAEWSITFVDNTSDCDLVLSELSWPCSGPASGAYGWIVWPNQGALPGPASTATYYGPYTPVDPNPATFPPTTYSYIDVSASNVPFALGSTLCFGFDNTGMQGMTAYNGVVTYGWYGGIWDDDSPYGRTVIMQLKANCAGTVPTENASWGQVKALYK